MSEQQAIINAVSHLEMTKRGARALQALREALPHMTNLDSLNRRAVWELLSSFFGDYPGTVLDTIGAAEDTTPRPG